MVILYTSTDDGEVERIPIVGTGVNEDGEWFIFLEGELMPRLVGYIEWDDDKHIKFEHVDYLVEKDAAHGQR